MCGIIGIMNKDFVAEELYQGLIALQHRGQDSAGIITIDKVRANTKKGLGLVSDIFTTSNLSLLAGNYGIAHVRYSTAGGSLKKDAQPFLVGYPNLICLAHNGNILNCGEINKQFKDIMESDSDSEMMLHLFTSHLQKKEITEEDVFDAVKKTMQELNGSYSVVCAIAGIGLLAFRDPHGIRPLIMGKKDTSIAFTSESVALDTLGYDIVRDVSAGEAIIVKENGQIIERVLYKRNEKHCMFEWVYFSRPDSIIDGKSVYTARVDLGKNLAKHIKFKGDVIVAVPDTSKPSARGLSKELKIDAEDGLIRNRYVGRTFIMPTQKQRDRAIFVKLNPNKAVVKDKNVILIDDSIVRGSTSRRIVKVMKRYSKDICFVSACPPIKYPCYYGVDFPLPEELIASKKTIDEIRKEIGADDLVYATIDDIKNAIGTENLCTACLDGKYPTHVCSELEDKIHYTRKKEREQN